MSIIWQMAFGNKAPYWMEQTGEYKYESSECVGTADDIAKESYKLDRVLLKRLEGILHEVVK